MAVGRRLVGAVSTRPLSGAVPCAAGVALCVTAAAFAAPVAAQNDQDADIGLSVDGPAVVLSGVLVSLTLLAENVGPEGATYRVLTAGGATIASGSLPARQDVVTDEFAVEDGDLPLTVEVSAGVLSASGKFTAPLWPGWVSLLPPLVAIVLALVFREVVVSLFFGVWIGAALTTGLNPVTAVWRTIDSFIVPALADIDHASILMFSALLGAMVGVMSRSGGTKGVVGAVSPLATTPRRAQAATFGAGLGIFFDDYANTLVVGNTFRPITDRLKVAREKLAYVVDSTAAPVVTLMFVSTWVGFQLSLIDEALPAAAETATDPALAEALMDASAFTVFVSGIQYLFYPILALAMVVTLIWTQRDFGPMLAAERRARGGGGVFRPGSQLMLDTESHGLEPKEGAPERWFNAAAPVATVVLVVLIGLYTDGRAAAMALDPVTYGEGGQGVSIRTAFEQANPFNAILWGALAGCIVAIALAVGQKILTIKEALDGWMSGIRAMSMAFVILILAWSLGGVTKEISTAHYLTMLMEGNLRPEFLPALTFLTAAVISFCTGTAWATMTVLIPLVVPLSVALGGAAGWESGFGGTLMVSSISSVLAGSIFGDHCSPISDTTVLSSMASACDHLDHVRTQLPYALTVAAAATVFGYVGTSIGLPVVLAYVLSLGSLFAVVRFVGKPVEASP